MSINVGKFGVPAEFFKPESNKTQKKEIIHSAVEAARISKPAPSMTSSLTDVLSANLTVAINAEDTHASPMISSERATESKLVFKGNGVVDALAALENGTVEYRGTSKVNFNVPIYRG